MIASYPCPSCDTPISVDARTGTDWWSASCHACGHQFQLWRCPGGGHLCTFTAYEQDDREGLECDGCGHQHEVLRVDDTVRELRDALATVQGFGPQFARLGLLVAGGLRMHTDQLNPERAHGAEGGAPYPANRHARKIVSLAARAQADGKLTRQRAAKLMRGMR